ncbi:uncharacterized protein zgc:193593 [Colossoma macropomum]|uniref:uncharacterized protein zgc:193593 n=1 Tax=Colossoma macropomum TaxID=42526 RepID=UPI0018650A00|nr:uncharacterized protein zgc:193593 [Colossoma macropomum]
MIFRLPRLTPGYIRYLQTQAMQTITYRAGDVVMPRLAVLLGALGIGMSGYSSHQLALHHHPSARVLQWLERTAPPRGQTTSALATQLQNLGQHSPTPKVP